MITLIRLVILFAIIVVGWILFRELLYALGVLQRPGAKRTFRNDYSSGKGQKQPPFEYNDVKDAQFREIPDDSNDTANQ